MVAYPPIVVSASQRFTTDWDRSKLAQVRVSFQYCDAIYRSGGLPLVVGSWTGEGEKFFEGRGQAQPTPRKVEPLLGKAGALMETARGLLLTGGGDVMMRDEDGSDQVREMDRDRDFWEAALFKSALERRKPILGICRGLQLINVALGGDLWDDIPSQYPNPVPHQQHTTRRRTSHEVNLKEGSKLAQICGQSRLRVNSGHHQAAKNVAKGLTATGWTEDGLIEALEIDSYPWGVAVQWHPEALAHREPMAKALFDAFVEACR